MVWAVFQELGLAPWLQPPICVGTIWIWTRAQGIKPIKTRWRARLRVLTSTRQNAFGMNQSRD